MLSGMALRIQTDKYGIRLRWLVARLVRLLPIYWIAYLTPLFGLFVIDSELDITPLQLLVTLIGMNAFVPMWSGPKHNPALWSLSVEIILSALLVIIGRPKKTYLQFVGFFS